MDIEKNEYVSIEQVLESAQKIFRTGNLEKVIDYLSAAEKTYRKVLMLFFLVYLIFLILISF
jgi:hypothetical protein